MRLAPLVLVVAVFACGAAEAAKPPPPRFAVPFGIATIAGQVYVADWKLGRVLRYDPRRRRLKVIARRLREPTDMAAAGGVLYLTEFGAGRVVRVTSQGRRTPVAQVPLPTGVAVHDRMLYVASLANYVFRVDLETGRREVIAGDGTEAESGDGGPARAAQVVGSHGISVDSSGNVYFQGRTGTRRIDAAGRISTFSPQATFKTAPAPDGGLFFIDGDPTRGVLGRIAPGGEVRTIWRGRRPPTDLVRQPDGTLLFGLGEPRAIVYRLDPDTGRLSVVLRSR